MLKCFLSYYSNGYYTSKLSSSTDEENRLAYETDLIAENTNDEIHAKMQQKDIWPYLYICLL